MRLFGGCDRRFARGLGFGHHFWGHHRRGGGPRMQRVFDHGDLRLIILDLIAAKPRHGYEIIKAVEEMLAGWYSPSPGVVYPTLTMLEELGHASVSASDGAKKLYSITPEGEAWLRDNRVAVEAVRARIAEATAAYGGGPPPQILRAMENMRLALRLRVTRGPLEEEAVRAITAALDGAATAIERA